MAGGQIAAKGVIANGGPAQPVGAQGKHKGHVPVHELAGQLLPIARCRQDQAIHAPPQQRIGGAFVGSGLVFGCCHDGEKAGSCRGTGQGLIDHGHHRIRQPRNDHTHHAGLAAPQR